MFEELFQPLKVGALSLKSRFVMPAMSSHYVDTTHHYKEQAKYYYAARAKGGFGLQITEYLCVSREGLASTSQPAIYDDTFIPTLSEVTAQVHKEGGCIFAQLQHSGNQSSREAAGEEAVGASSVPAFNNCLPVHALSTDEVWELRSSFLPRLISVRIFLAGASGSVPALSVKL